MSFPCEVSVAKESDVRLQTRSVHTIGAEIAKAGIGLFTGAEVTIKLCPAKEGTGIVFQRTDLPGQPIIPAHQQFVQGTPRCTILGKEGVSIQTVEHLLAALAAYNIDNLLIQISGAEVPVFDGSSLAFITMIEEAGIQKQVSSKTIHAITQPLYWTQGEVHLVALPSDEYRISYTLHYPKSSLLHSQFYSVKVDADSFKHEIAPCRTFSIFEEIAPYIEKGLFKGGGLQNAVVIKEDKVLNPEGLRFTDEMVRHKILDMIGDLSLVGVPFRAHIIAIRSGHFSNTAFASDIINHIRMEKE